LMDRKQFCVRGWCWPQKAGVGRCGFSLLEILLAVSLLALAATITFMTFSAAMMAWQRGTALMDRLHHGDYVINQLVVALRSTYWKDDSGQGQYGFVHTPGGFGPESPAAISWVKLGGSLVGRDQDFVETPHRVRFFIQDEPRGAAFTAWRLAGQADDFDPDLLEPTLLSERVIGFSCRMAYMLDQNEDIDWLDEWELTNQVPLLLEVTLYLEPVMERDPPIEMRRVVGILTAQESHRGR
jgi:prepilin-type N-terminal cleavage/methylation domain-containing protein